MLSFHIFLWGPKALGGGFYIEPGFDIKGGFPDNASLILKQ